MVRLILIVSFVGLVFDIHYSIGREWSDSTGKFKVTGDFVRLVDGKITLKRSVDGREITVPLDRLSAPDQEFARNVVGPAKPPGPAGDPIAELEKAASSQRTAKDAVLVYSKAIADPKRADQKPQMQGRLRYWTELAAKKSVRMGDAWMAIEQAKLIESIEEKLVTESQRMLEVGNDKLAVERLKKASQTNPQSIASDFQLGLLYALLGRQADEAEKRFSACVRRRQWCINTLQNVERANLVSALNNAALARIRLGDFRVALNLWQQAMEIAPPAGEIVQNLGKMNELSSSHPEFKIPASSSRAAADLYASVASRSDARYERNIGWLYMKFIPEPSCEGLLESISPPKPTVPLPETTKSKTTPESLILIGSGTGFLAGPKLVITNRHVVNGAEALQVTLPGKKGETAPATLVFTSDKGYDLALIKCEKLESPSLMLSAVAPKLGAELVVVGFPAPGLLGQSIKATKGIVSGLPERAVDNMLLYDAVTNPGNSGSPVCDRFGRVVAVHAIGVNPGFAKYGGGVPVEHVDGLLKSASVPAIPIPASSPELSWEDVVAMVEKSTVQILLYQKPDKLRFEKNLADLGGRKKEWSAYEDDYCLKCYGHGLVGCPAKGCVSGRVSSRVQEAIGTNAVTGAPITVTKTVASACDNCNGTGRVACPFCR